MRASKFPGANRRFGAPSDWDEAKRGPCLTIYGYRDEVNDNCTTVWEPTPEERAQIAAGANIALVNPGRAPMPVNVLVANVPALPDD